MKPQKYLEVHCRCDWHHAAGKLDLGLEPRPWPRASLVLHLLPRGSGSICSGAFYTVISTPRWLAFSRATEVWGRAAATAAKQFALRTAGFSCRGTVCSALKLCKLVSEEIFPNRLFKIQKQLS